MTYKEVLQKAISNYEKKIKKGEASAQPSLQPTKEEEFIPPVVTKAGIGIGTIALIGGGGYLAYQFLKKRKKKERAGLTGFGQFNLGSAIPVLLLIAGGGYLWWKSRKEKEAEEKTELISKVAPAITATAEAKTSAVRPLLSPSLVTTTFGSK